MRSLEIKSAVTPREVQMLRRLAAGKRVIEVGSLLGFSTIHMAQTALSVEAIDPHCGYPYYNPAPTLPEFRHNVTRYGVAHKIREHLATAQQVLDKLTGDFTFIDCTGFYEDTLFALEHGHGVIACHDFGRQGCGGVERAVLEHVRRHNKSLSVVDTLAVIT